MVSFIHSLIHPFIHSANSFCTTDMWQTLQYFWGIHSEENKVLTLCSYILVLKRNEIKE